ncbi:MAG: energy transducer TonB [Sphingomicrobium sp.]
MYREHLGAKDRGGAITAVIAIHAALLFALLNISGRMDFGAEQSVMRVFDVSALQPPPPPPPAQQKMQPRPKQKEGGSVPKNVRSEATPVVAPTPKVTIPTPPVSAAAETPRQGTAPTQGASDVRGPGTGAGGAGNGTDSGSGGNGPGGGGDNGVAEPPRLASPVLLGRDLPRALLDQWPRGATVFLRLRVDTRGYISECSVDRGTGVRAIDSTMCNIAHDRLRFRPALNRSGQAVAGWFGYAQPAPR